jgi:adenosylcobinamide amidohydrolase
MSLPPLPDVRLVSRAEGGRDWPALVWLPPPGWRMISTALYGGGLGERRWWFNTQVDMAYFEPDPVAHARRIAADLGLRGPGAGMLTAADARYWAQARDGGVLAAATVGLGLPVPAAAPAERIAVETDPVRAVAWTPGTINVLAAVPVPLGDAALVNLVVTATEAKTQALLEAGVPGTGTSSDAVAVACPLPTGDTEPEEYGGPRSVWGARVARAVHEAVATGTLGWLGRHPDGDPHRRWGATGVRS